MTNKRSAPKRSLRRDPAPLRTFLDEQWSAFEPRVNAFQWPIETARWYELVFCILHRLGRPDLPAGRARQITEDLAHLNLLDVKQLAIMLDGTQVVLDGKHARLIVDSLEQGGMDRERAESVLVTLVEVASSLAEKYDGKIQRCLRRYGNAVLDDLPKQFPLTRMTRDDAQLAFTLWLQNVLNLPIELWDEDVRDVCRLFRASRETLVRTADDMELNVALVDDVLTSFSQPPSRHAARPREKRRETRRATRASESRT